MEKVRDAIINRMRRYWEILGKSKAVIGISGGKDSTVCAALCVRALGADNVISVSMPHERVNEELMREVVKATGLKGGFNFIYQPIGEAEKVLTGNILFRSPQAEINIKPRLRTALEYYIAQSLGDALVICTSNFDEILLGWYTLWGDAGDYAPINRLHVSEVIELGRTLGIPEDLLTIPPSDGLTDRTDEENLGFTYKDVEEVCHKIDVMYEEIAPDRYLGELPVLGFIGLDVRPGAAVERHFETETDRKIYERWKNNRFKQEMMSIPGPGDDIRYYLDKRMEDLLP